MIDFVGASSGTGFDVEIKRGNLFFTFNSRHGDYSWTFRHRDGDFEPQADGCTGEVFNISDSENFTINNSILFGSGTWGIVGIRVNGLKVNNSVIKECTYGIMDLYDSRDIEFNGCNFFDNNGSLSVVLKSVHNITFNSSRFYDNTAGGCAFENCFFFHIDNSTQINVNDCLFRNNTAANYLAEKRSMINMTDVRLEGQGFKYRLFKEE